MLQEVSKCSEGVATNVTEGAENATEGVATNVTEGAQNATEGIDH